MVYFSDKLAKNGPICEKTSASDKKSSDIMVQIYNIWTTSVILPVFVSITSVH